MSRNLLRQHDTAFSSSFTNNVDHAGYRPWPSGASPVGPGGEAIACQDGQVSVDSFRRRSSGMNRRRYLAKNPVFRVATTAGVAACVAGYADATSHREIPAMIGKFLIKPARRVRSQYPSPSSRANSLAATWCCCSALSSSLTNSCLSRWDRARIAGTWRDNKRSRPDTRSKAPMRHRLVQVPKCRSDTEPSGSLNAEWTYPAAAMLLRIPSIIVRRIMKSRIRVLISLQSPQRRDRFVPRPRASDRATM